MFGNSVVRVSAPVLGWATSLLRDRAEEARVRAGEEVGALMENITMIAMPDAHAFLPRLVAPATYRFPGSALPIGGALELTGGPAKRRTATDPRQHLIRTPMI